MVEAMGLKVMAWRPLSMANLLTEVHKKSTIWFKS
jgi:hypothetical protein